jgi:outer membrane protein assembly factor BamA
MIPKKANNCHEWLHFCIISLLILFTLQTLKAEQTTKTGLNLGVLPAVSYNSDEGFQYGAILNLFNYGNGKRYPAYDYSAYLEVSRFTKGSRLFRFYFDTDKLLPGIRSFADISYIQDDLLPFYGFNGYQSIYSKDTMQANRAFYSMSQGQFRILFDLKGRFLMNYLNWILSYNFYNYTTGEVDFNQLNTDVSVTDSRYLPGTSLYSKYVDWNLIPTSEANGGSLQVIKAGLQFDSRNAPVNPDDGIYTEALVELAPGFLNKFPYARYSIVHREYFAVIKHQLNFAYRVGAQGKIGKNNLPFYRLSQLVSPFATRSNVTGLGGDNSLRGILKNRIVGNGIAYGNFELRWKTYSFDLINQHFYIGLNGFLDTGIITDPINMDLTAVPSDERAIYFSSMEKQTFHTAVGGGLKLAMNENFVVSLDMGKALNENDGEGLGTYIKINYLF